MLQRPRSATQSSYNSDILTFMKTKQNHPSLPPFTIAMSGAAETGHCAPTAFENTVKLDTLIAQRGAILVTGATHGAPQWAAKAAKEAGGTVIGFSPAASARHHIKTYHLPIDYHDLIVYTGFDYVGRNLILTRAADAVITICGRIGTLNEYTVAFEEQTIQGVLVGSGGMADDLEAIVEKSHRGRGKTVFESDPESLLDQVMEMIKEEKKDLAELQNSRTQLGNEDSDTI